MGDSVLPEAWLRAHGSQGRAFEAVLGYPRPPDRDIGGPGEKDAVPVRVATDRLVRPFASVHERRSGVKKERGPVTAGCARERAVLDEFIAACLDHAQQQLIGEGSAKGTIHFGYGMKGEGSEPAICHYALTRQDTDKAAQEIGEIRAYATKTGAEAVSIAMDLGAGTRHATFFRRATAYSWWPPSRSTDRSGSCGRTRGPAAASSWGSQGSSTPLRRRSSRGFSGQRRKDGRGLTR